MVKIPPERMRVQKSEVTLLEEKLENLGIDFMYIRPTGEKINVYDKAWNHVVGFYWSKADKKTGAPGRWVMQLTLPVHSHGDLDTALSEFKRMHTLTTEATEAWQRFQRTKSEKAWAEYMGIMAALYMSGGY